MCGRGYIPIPTGCEEFEQIPGTGMSKDGWGGMVAREAQAPSYKDTDRYDSIGGNVKPRMNIHGRKKSFGKVTSVCL